MFSPPTAPDPEPAPTPSTGGVPAASTVLTYTVEAERIAPGISVARTREAAIQFDSSPGLADDRFGPADLLGAALAACLLKNVERFAALLPFRYEAASVRVTLEREDRPPRIARIRYRLVLTTDEPPRRVDLLERNLLRFGTVLNTLSTACEVRGEVVAVAPGLDR